MHEGYRFDPIAVGITDEGGVITLAMLRPEAGRAVAGSAGHKSGLVEGVDHIGCASAKADMRAAWSRNRPGAKIDPELGILLAEADSRRPRLQFDDSDRGE